MADVDPMKTDPSVGQTGQAAAFGRTTPDSTDETRLEPIPEGPPPCGPGGDPVQPPLATGFERYLAPRVIGSGGVGTVRSFHDPNLGRRVAIKELHPNLRGQCAQRTRFFREARVTARLQHPNIMPVYELGMASGGSPYFAMKEVTTGVSLQKILRELREGLPATVSKYPTTRLLEVFLDVCQAVAFAHSQGVIHRDLKPENVLLGEFGEVLVTDWGLTKVIGAPPTPDDGEDKLEMAHDAATTASVTIDGSVSGTPLYMAPEQALGLVTQLDGRSDLYSLGAILYELLTLEKAIPGESLSDVLGNVIAGNIVPPGKRVPERKVPCDLSAICMHCLALRQDDRYQTVEELIEDLRRYQQGLPVSVRPYTAVEKSWKFLLRHPVASASLATVVGLLMVVGALHGTFRYARYRQLVSLADKNRENGNRLYEREFELLQQLTAMQQARLVETRSEAEARLEAEMASLLNDAENAYQTAVMLYLFATDTKPGLEISAAISEIFVTRLNYALASEDYRSAEQWLSLLRYWLGDDFGKAGPTVQATIREMADRVRGDGELAVDTQPIPARVRMQNLDKAIDGGPAAFADMGMTPVAPFAVPKGRYLLTFDGPGMPTVKFPLFVKHGETKSVTVHLPKEVPQGMVYVPAGSFLAGGPNARHYRLHEEYLDGYFIRKHEVTFGEYLAFWRARGGAAADRGLMSRVELDRGDRQYRDAWDAEGVLVADLREELPVVGVTREAAAAYCAWLSGELGRPIRLPSAEEWEKAARGVDGRTYVWGNEYHPGHAFTIENEAALATFGRWAPPGSFPRDRSIYDAYDLGGNVREWTGSQFPGNSPFYQIKGASAATTRRFLDCSYASDTPVVPTDVGFRYVMPIQPGKDFGP